MRRRLVVSTIAIVLVVLVAAAVPVAVLLRDAGSRQLEFRLDRQLDEAVAVAERCGARRTLLVHLSHDVPHAELTARLPRGIEVAHDGLEVPLEGLM